LLRASRPELAIIDRDTRDAVQAVLTVHARNYKARTVPHGNTDYLLTGLLRCGCGGAPMQIMGGSAQRYYRCVANRKRGTCSNRLSVREGLTRARILEAVSGALATPKAIAYCASAFAERVFRLRALTVQSARTALRTYFKGGTITMTPEPLGDGQAYVSRAEFLPLVLLNQNA
jgi:hypothetical protein